MELYHSAPCGSCHGGQGNNSGSGAPDLRESASLTDFETFKSLTKDGFWLITVCQNSDDLADSEINAIYEYLRQRTKIAAADLKN